MGEEFAKFTARGGERILAVVNRVEHAGYDERGRSRQWNKTGEDSVDPTGGAGGTGGSGCCCAEMDCIKPIPGVEEMPPPAYREFDAFAICGCEGGDTSGKLRLYQVDPEDDTIWETKHAEEDDNILMCRYPDCTATREWTWNGTTWDAGAITGASCGEPEIPDYDGTEVGQTAETDYQPELQVSWWRETKLGKDANGCDLSKLEFFIGTE